MKTYDAIIVGSGPNGLAAAITLQRKGLRTLIIEGAATIGGGMRSTELTLPGYLHDVCSAVHPMAMGSPFFASLPLVDYGLRFVAAPYEAAHPMDREDTVFLHRSLEKTAHSLDSDAAAYKRLIAPVAEGWEKLVPDIMGPLRFPKHPLLMAKFGWNGLRSASSIAKGFRTERAKALWAGMAAHGMQPLSNLTTGAIGMVLLGVGHRHGWGIPIGGSQAIADAMAAYYKDLGGELQTGAWLRDVADLPAHQCLLLDLTAKQLLAIKGLKLSEHYKRQLACYRQGMGVFKVDWALSEAIPFKDKRCQKASTVHLGNTFSEIAANEQHSNLGRLVEKPFVLLAQQSMFDRSRAPEGKHTGWAYCHVPFGSTVDRTAAIEAQVERFAPGFKDIILGRSTMNCMQMEAYNPNYVGGDINGGQMDIFQLYTRPTLKLNPYRTSNRQVYICSSSTPPGGGVHGLCGFHAAETAWQDHFKKLS